MPDSDVPGLSEATSIADTDVLHVVTDPGGGSEADEKVTKANLLADVTRVVGTSSPSGVAGVDFTLPSSGFTCFTLRGWLTPATDAVDLFLRCNDGSGFDSTNEYWNATAVSDSAGNYADEGGSADAAIEVFRTSNWVGSGPGEAVLFHTVIERAMEADYTYFNSRTSVGVDLTAASGLQRGNAAGIHAVSATLTQIRVLFSAGNIADGELRLIGIP